MQHLLVSSVLFLLLSTHSLGSPSTLLQCYNQDSSEQAWLPGKFDEFTRGNVSRLHLHKVWWSSKNAPGSGKGGKGGLTIVTGTTLSRLESLQAQCRQWVGILSAAIYIPLKHRRLYGSELSSEAKAELNSAVSTVNLLFVKSEADKGACALRLLLVYELVGDDLLGHLLPINSLRNTAMLAAETELMAMIDVDLLPSKQLSELVTKDTAGWSWIRKTCEQRKVVVMAAFETHPDLPLEEGQQLAEETTQGDKVAALIAASQGRIIPFAKQAYAPGHNATNFLQWFAAKEPYEVEYQTNFEPWFIIQRSAALLYDARFRGYGWNKASQVIHLNITGWGFTVHPSLFLVHRPHVKSGAQTVYQQATQHSVDVSALAATKAGKTKAKAATAVKKGPNIAPERLARAKEAHRKVMALKSDLITKVNRGVYVYQPGAGVAACMKTLPWWTGLHPELLPSPPPPAPNPPLAAN